MAVLNALAQIFAPQAKAWIVPLSDADGKEVTGEAFAFQYFPETISDSKGVNYSERDVPGGSHPLYQWVSGGARSLSFEAVFVHEDRASSPFRVKTSAQADKYNTDVNGGIARLREFLYPAYDSDGISRPPRRLMLHLPGILLGANTGDALFLQDTVMCVMKTADVEYMYEFPDGTPRVAKVSLAFDEIVQRPGRGSGGIRFVDRQQFSTTKIRYKIKPNRLSSTESADTQLDVPSVV